MKVKSDSEITLSNAMDYSLPGSSVHGIFQAKVLEWGAIAFSPVSARLPIFSKDMGIVLGFRMGNMCIPVVDSC